MPSKDLTQHILSTAETSTDRFFKKKKRKDFPTGPVVKNPLPMQGAQVQFLIRELRSHKPRGDSAWAPQLPSSLTPQLSPDAAK